MAILDITSKNQYNSIENSGITDSHNMNALDFEVGDLIFTGSDTIMTRSIGLLDKAIIFAQRIHSLIFHGKFFSTSARNTHVSIVVEVDRINNKVWIAEANPTKNHKNDLREVNIIKHHYYQLDSGSKETYEVLRCNQQNAQLQGYVKNAVEKAHALAKRVLTTETQPNTPGVPVDAPVPNSASVKHKFSHLKGFYALFAKEKRGKDLTTEEFDFTKEHRFFCSHFVSLMLRQGEFASKEQAGDVQGLQKDNVTFDFDAETNSPQKLREFLEKRQLFQRVGIISAPKTSSEKPVQAG